MTSAREPQLRLFVAVELSAEWLEALRDVQEELKGAFAKLLSAGPNLRWVRPEGVHITLKFLGETPQSGLRGVEAGLARAISRPLDAELTLLGLGMFPERGSARVLWAGIEGDVARVGAVAARIDQEMSLLGYPKENRPFAPHLTLARVAEGSPRLTREQLQAVLSKVRLPEPAALSVSQVSLMRSHLGPGGARYEQLASFPND